MTTLPTAPTAAQDDDITFESGVTANGTIASPAFADITSFSPITYTPTQDLASKWDNNAAGAQAAVSSAAGTGGGTVTYSFDSSVTSAEQTAFTSALTLWSDEVNIHFQLVAPSAATDITFSVTTSGGTFFSSSPYNLDTVGSPQISSLNAGNSISFQEDANKSYGTIGSFSAQGGYGVAATVHEIGHAIGLGHSGPYNDGSGGGSPSQVQLDPYDSRQWSAMSYIDPSDTTATYYNQYTVTGTQDTTLDGNLIYNVAPETPMIDDIEAAQRLYGASTSTALAGGQVFGFNCNITDASKSFFDFTQNTNPFITLYDSGMNNTLDVSGFSTDCSINLNPGSFSTAAYSTTLTNNIGIAYGTRIDTAIGGSGDDTFTVNADSDTINGGGGTNTVVFSGNESAYSIATVNGTIDVTKNLTTDMLTNIQKLQFADQTLAVCFVSGTRIRTLRDGQPCDIAVEALRVGDLAVTASGAHRPIRWIGHRTMDCRNHSRPQDALPVRIAAHALGTNKPSRDLWVSPGHAICVDILGEVLITAGALVNGATIQQVAVESVTYWHVELDSHDILLAENLPAESYLPMGNRAFFVENDVVAFDVSPDADLDRTHADFCRPYYFEGALVEAARGQLRARALALGWTMGHAPLADLHLIVDGEPIVPAARGLQARFLVPAGARDVWLVSAASRPCDLGGVSDARDLGVCVAGLAIDDGFGGNRTIALDDPRLGVGFHHAEDGGWRWTNGRAQLPAALWEDGAESFFLRVDLASPALPHWVAPANTTSADDNADERANNVVALRGA
jgi:serralysin